MGRVADLSPDQIEARRLRGRESRRRAQRKYQLAHPERIREKMRIQRAKRFGLGPSDHDTILSLQGGGCALCGSTKPFGNGKCGKFHMDHDHRTGKFRGLLCSRCNMGIGLFQENALLLHRVIEYLEIHAEVPDEQCG